MQNNAKEHYLREWKKVAKQPDEQASWRSQTPTSDFLEFLEWIAGQQEPGRALDIGCGRGRNAIPLGEQGYYVCGIDISSEAIALITEFAEAKRIQGEFVVGDSCELPWEDESFVLANDHGCFHHIHPDRWKMYREELLRVLKPGAIFRMKLFSKHCEWYERHKRGNEQWVEIPDFTHIYFITQEEIEQLFGQYFTILKIDLLQKKKEGQSLYHVIMKKNEI